MSTAAPRLAFLIDSPNIGRGRALAGTPARVLALAEHTRTNGAEVTLVICDHGDDYGTSADWSTDVMLVHPADYYDAAQLARQLGALALDAVIVCDAPTVIDVGRALADELSARLIYDVHDDDATLESSLGSPPERVAEAAAGQRRAFALADAVIACATREVELAIRSGVAPARVAYVPNGADPSRYAWGPNVAARRLVMIGNLFYRPNQLALDHLTAMAPQLLRRMPTLRIDIIGRGPVALAASHPDLRFQGPIDSIDDALRGASLGLAPLTAGAGSKCKVLDYAAAALPTLGTTEAVTGLPAGHPGVDVLDDLAQWPRRITELLRRPFALEEIGRKGREMVERERAWPVIAQELVRQVQQWKALPPHVIRPSAGPLVGRARWAQEHTSQGVSLEAEHTEPGAPRWISSTSTVVAR